MNPSGDNNFNQAELDKFGALAQRWWGEPACSRAIGSHTGERTAMEGRSGRLRHGWLSPDGGFA